MEGKIYTVNLPDIGEGVVEGEVLEWLKPEGAAVSQDEPVVVVMTDKATVELPAPYPGTIGKHYYKPGEIAYKDKPIYDILLQNDAPIHTKKELPALSCSGASIVSKQPVKNTPLTRPQSATASSGKALATPAVRCLAREFGIDISKLHGTGKDGRVLKEDLLHLDFTRKQPEPAPTRQLDGDEEQPLIGIRGLMAKKMFHTHQNVPQFSYFEEADATRIILLRQRIKGKAANEGINLSFMPFFIRALTLTIKKYPLLNSSIDMQAGKIIIHHQHNIGVAMASNHGLIVPVLKGVQNMRLEELIKAYEELKNKALAGKVSPSDMKDGTITISNFGALGEGTWATPMVSEPEAAILGIARIRKIPFVKDDAILAKDIIPLSWSFDHRILDGQLASAVSREFCRLLKDPASLL